MRSATKSIFAAALLAMPLAARAEDAIQFAPPPVPMINLTANDAVHTNTFDYMNLKLSGFNLHCANFGMGMMERMWEKGGWNRLMAAQFIVGDADIGEMSGGFSSGKFTMAGAGFNFPVNLFIDPLSEDTDDPSLPIYAGIHLGMSMLTGSFTMSIPTGFDMATMSLIYRDYVTTILMTTGTAGWQMGVQAGINLGPYLKFVPYVDISQELFMAVGTSMTNAFDSSSTSSGNLGPMPVSLMPGFDLILRKYGLSLGGAYKTMKQDSGDMKMFNLHFRFTKKFKSICG